jgi:hypothetical protein
MAKSLDRDPRLRLRGWRAALRSPNTPEWLRPAMRENIRKLERRLRSHRRKSASPLGGVRDSLPVNLPRGKGLRT